MEIKVKALEDGHEKSTAQVEEILLEKHEEKLEAESQSKEEAAPVQEEAPKEDSGINDSSVLSYIKERYDKDFSSVEEVLAARESNEELPEDVSAYFKYKKDTGRGMQDFMKLQQDFDTMDVDEMLKSYYTATEEGLDASDIDDIIESKFSFDEDFDDEKEIKKIKIAKKRELTKARKFFEEQREQYKTPLESSGGGLSSQDQESLEAYKSYIKESASIGEANQKKYDWFLQKTNEVFSDEFKGFEFNVGDRDITYKPGTSEELKNVQSDVNNFVKKFTDKDGMMSDASGYHRALALAMQPEKFAKYFYEQGRVNAVDDVTRKSKNINMDIRQTPQVTSKGGNTVRAVGDTSSGKGLKIRSIKNN